MSLLSRIPGLGPLAAVLAHTVALHSNPTLRRYHDILATTFYHHGRFCASNQATVIFLVIVFVGIISYPGIITSYNASAYAHQHRSPTSTTGTLAPALASASRHFPAGNLDLFWTQHHHRVITPIWTEQPEIHSQNLPSTHPLGYLAPVIINATQLLAPSNNNNNTTHDNVQPLWSEADLLAYAAHIQRRLEAIVVDVSAQDNSPLSAHNTDRGAGSGSTTPPAKDSRLVRLGDICLQSTPVLPSETDEPNTGDSKQPQPSNTVAGLGCLVHSPQIHWRHDHDPKDSQDTLQQDRNTTSGSVLSLFGGLASDPRVQHGQGSASLVFTYFLRGDLAASGIQGETRGQLDVRRAWRLIFEQLVKELHVSRTAEDDDPDHDPKKFVSEQGTPYSTLFATRGTTTSHHANKLGSKRLVSEKNIQPRSNISAEYWLLAMAYFVMFLYISLSVGRVDLVKSKYGLGIAAVATVFVSLLMSIGLCSVFGVTLTLMPWEILPFMIIVVGVENINILVHAVVETSMDLPVKERVGRGLGSVGVSITMTLVAELCLLIVGAMTTIPAVQEFCTFAIAAVVMDYLLQMTFFITVISIDIRRLELSDLSSRPAAPYARYPFGARHPSILKTGPHAGDADSARFGARFPAGGGVSFADQGSKHHRSDSATSLNSDGDAKSSRIHSKKSRHGRIFTSFVIIGLMTYLGYIYGTTNHTISGAQDLVPTSFWRITSPEVSAKFWSMVDPGDNGGYLEIEEPFVVSLQRHSDDSTNALCLDLPEAMDHDHHCEDDLDGNAGSAEEREKAARDGQLDPRRPFKLLRDAFVFICLFAFWLLRVFVIPSIIMSAAILLLLSYLLSPQRKLLVDLQWTFPFIVLPGDYQSKRKLMMEELLAQEAKELGLDPRPCPVIPGTVETLCWNGHETDIDQMDVSAGMGLILTSSMDGVILLWDGMSVEGLGTPIARLQDSAFSTPSRQRQDQFTRIPRSKARAVKCLRLDPTGTIAAASFGEGGIHLWRVDAVAGRYGQGRIERTPCLAPVQELVRTSDSNLDASKLKVSTIFFWDQKSLCNRQYSSPSCAASIPASHDMLVLAGYRDGQVWEWDPVSGRGKCIAQTQFRGGIADLSIIELEETVRQELGLKPSTYLLAAGKDGSLQCWTRTRTSAAGPAPSAWHAQWSHRGPGVGISISVLSLDAEVPMVATGYSNGAIKVWDLENGNLVWTLSRGSHPAPGQADGAASASRHHNRRSSRGDLDSHQPSHQGAITKLCFHALELEDGLTGAPAPRVWLLISSGLDETVMVWMVEWEGLMALPLNQAASAGSNGLVPDISLTACTSPSTATMSEPRDFSQVKDRPRPMASRQGSRDWTSSGINGIHQTEFLGTLSSSLPAPRLLGFMKQRGGKSITVSNSCLYGVRRKESSSASLSTSNNNDTRKPSSHTALLDATISSQSILRSRRRSDGHALTPTSGAQDSQHAPNISSSSSNSPAKRGWELWEADLYQCIFKDPGLWSLDLTVRAISLQLHSPLPIRRPSPSASFGQHWSKPTDREPETISVNSNGSGMAVPVVVLDQEAQGLGFGPDSNLADGGSNYARPKMHRRPGSFTHQGQGGGGQRGFVVPTGLTQPQHPFGPQTTYAGNNMNWDDEDPLENNTPMLLPFVETRLVHTIQKRPDLRPWRREDQEADAEGGRGPEVKDIVIGFGNFIKIVRLVDEEDGPGTGHNNSNMAHLDYHDSAAE
ncbi:hypothetical protein BGZ72_005042 [Mortierella alpina]|nr:hypothetical protein BGZ72_005042 [Mortierella alpina]